MRWYNRCFNNRSTFPLCCGSMSTTTVLTLTSAVVDLHLPISSNWVIASTQMPSNHMILPINIFQSDSPKYFRLWRILVMSTIFRRGIITVDIKYSQTKMQAKFWLSEWDLFSYFSFFFKYKHFNLCSVMYYHEMFWVNIMLQKELFCWDRNKELKTTLIFLQ